jgi:sulfite exporter TauE/SafE
MFRSSLSSSLFVIKRIHKILGNVMTLIGKVLATLIVNLNTSAEIFKAWLFFLAAIAFLWIAAEMIYRASSKSIIYKYFFKHKNKFAKYHNEIYQKLL